VQHVVAFLGLEVHAQLAAVRMFIDAGGDDARRSLHAPERAELARARRFGSRRWGRGRHGDGDDTPTPMLGALCD